MSGPLLQHSSWAIFASFRNLIRFFFKAASVVFAHQLNLVCVHFSKLGTLVLTAEIASSAGALHLPGANLCLGCAHCSSVCLVRMRNDADTTATFLRDQELS